MHISIEGIDGVGKTTVAKTVAEKLGFSFVEKPLSYLFDTDNSQENYLRIRDYFNKQPNRFLSAWFYGLGNVFLYEKFKGQNIVTDRHLLSNYSWSGTDKNLEIYDLLVKQIGSPDLTFILYADSETVTRRIKIRNAKDSDIAKVKYIPEMYMKMEDFCTRYNMPYVLIDTSNLNKDEVAELIINKIKELFK